MKTVAVDIRPLLERNWGGVSWYSYYIVTGLVERAARGELRVVLFYNQRKLLYGYIVTLLKKWRTLPHVAIAGYRMPNKLFNMSMRFFSFLNIDELIGLKVKNQELGIKNIDIFFIPNLAFIALSSQTPYIAVCHDLSWEIFPEFFTIRQRLWHRFINPRRFYTQAQRIIAVSENTKQDLVDLYHIDAARIDVAYPGIEHELFYPRDDTRLVCQKYHLPENFILSVGTLEPRKNYETLLEAFDMLLSGFPLLTKEGTKERFNLFPTYEGGTKGGIPHLVIVGAEGWKYDRIYRFLNRMKHKSRVKFLFNVTREDLPAIYSAARLFIYPSFYEGFGFPPLEAAACGTPVIVGHGSSLPEVMGDAALYIDPFNIADLASAMERLLSDRTLYDTLRTKGLRQAGKFQWDKLLKEIKQILF